MNLLIWHNQKKVGFPKKRGWYVIQKAEGGGYGVERWYGGNWLTMFEVIAWARLNVRS